MSSKGNVHGEGNYEATRQYNAATRRFIESGKVEQAARDAAPHSAAEAKQMKDAEQAALLRAKRGPQECEGARPSADESGRTPAVEDPPRDDRGAAPADRTAKAASH